MLGDELYEFFCRGMGLREVVDERNKSRHHQGILKRETAYYQRPTLPSKVECRVSHCETNNRQYR